VRSVPCWDHQQNTMLPCQEITHSAYSDQTCRHHICAHTWLMLLSLSVLGQNRVPKHCQADVHCCSLEAPPWSINNPATCRTPKPRLIHLDATTQQQLYTPEFGPTGKAL
jgi:hypothetical protein